MALRGDGFCVAAGRGTPFGPRLAIGDTVESCVDARLHTVSFAVNGARVGVAVGPPGSGTAIELPRAIGVARDIDSELGFVSSPICHIGEV